jgi:hypothetical protein
MPTLKNSGEFVSGNETTHARKSVTLARKVPASAKPNLSDTANGMTKGEALAVTWTGVEALKQMGSAQVFRSTVEPTVIWVKLLGTNYTVGSGLVEAK